MNRRELALVVDMVACYRLTRLVTKDSLLVNVRDWIIKRSYEPQTRNLSLTEPTEPGDWANYAEGDPSAPKLATLITCRWCTGIYVAVGVVAARSLVPRYWDPMARMLTVASAGALIAGLEK